MEVDIRLRLEGKEEFINVAHACLDLRNVHPELGDYEAQHPELVARLEQGVFPREVARVNARCIELLWFMATGDPRYTISRLAANFLPFQGVHISGRYQDDEGNAESFACIDGVLHWLQED